MWKYFGQIWFGFGIPVNNYDGKTLGRQHSQILKKSK